ncbi:MAG: pyruvate, phosphate dikinase [Gammaproteobacteria bacterium]|nr:pyruvate, phosphate dikinase [Gammaproteobacteria bacterium]MBQ0775757.1 pyruvate, phosphate dikinase [Gammaproteobacteria bacterium]
MPGFQALQRDHDVSLPLAPCWRVPREHVLAVTTEALVSELSALAGGDSHYWVLQQGPLAPGSKRQSLLNLDSDTALAAALNQTFRRDNGPESLIFQCMPPQKAAGVLFTRHPMRPDLDHIVIEGCLAGSDAQQRVILHADGQLAWRSEGSEVFLDEVSLLAFHELTQALHDSYGEARAAEWIWDGQRLWMVQALPIGTLPMPSEVWTRRAGLGFSPQAISPLWYTMLGRWLKEGFWRSLGRRVGWQELSNIEPYRRQHSYLYGNGRFFKALQSWQKSAFLWWALPPAWRASRPQGPQEQSKNNRSEPLSRAMTAVKLGWLRLKVRGVAEVTEAPSADDLWLELIRLDRLGEKLAGLEGHLGYVIAPAVASRGSKPTLHSLGQRTVEMLAVLPAVSRREISWDQFVRRFGGQSAGADPSFPRLREGGHDAQLLKDIVESLSEARLSALARFSTIKRSRFDWLSLRGQAADLRYDIASRLRRVLQQMSQRLVALRLIKHPDDIYFLYFDELWQAWQGQAQARRQLETLLGERKVRYLSDSHAGPPDWIIDSVGYGTSPLGQRASHDTVNGYGLVEGEACGRVLRVGSGWQLNQVQPGAILVLDQSDAGWLPWLASAAGLVLAHRDPLDPAAILACALGIPTVWGVDDAMHCLADGAQVSLNGSSGDLVQIMDAEM